MKNALLLLAISFISWKWYKGDFTDIASMVDEQGKPVVIVFTFADCGAPCADGMAELDKRGVPYRELEVDPEQQDADNFKLWEKFGRGAFPFIVAGTEKVIGTSRAQLATLLAVNFQEQYLTPYEKRYFRKHFAADGTPNIVMYGTSWCPGCADLRKELDAAGMPFIDIDVESGTDKAEITGTMEINGYPATWYGYHRMRGVTLSSIKTEIASLK